MARTNFSFGESELRSEVFQAVEEALTSLQPYPPAVQMFAVRQVVLELEMRAAAVASMQAPPKLQQTPTAALNSPYTVKQVAERLHVTPEAVKKWVGSGALRKTKAGGRTLITEEDIQDFLKRSTERTGR